MRIEAVEQCRRLRRPGDLQHHVGQFAPGAERIERAGIRGDDAADLRACEILLGVVVPQHHAKRQVAFRDGLQHAVPRFGGGLARHHVAREDHQVGMLRIEDVAHLGDGFFRLRPAVRRTEVEVHVGELCDPEFAVPAEMQGGRLCLCRTPQGDGTHKSRYLFHK